MNVKTCIIKKDISEKVLTIGSSFKSSLPGGGIISVLRMYDQNIEEFRHLPSWKPGLNYVTKWLYGGIALLRLTGRLLFDRKIKIVHLHTAAWGSFERKAIMARIASVAGKKIIIHMHAADFDTYLNQQKNPGRIIRSLQVADKLIVLSESWRNFFIKKGVNPDRIVQLNNIVSRPENYNKERTTSIKALFLGELTERKGVMDLLNAIETYKDQFDEKICFIIAGNGDENRIKNAIFEKKIDSLVKFEGWVSGDRKTECLKSADIYILPSYQEGLPIAILENMSYGQPVISTFAGGIPEIVHQHENGILFEAGNIQALGNAILFFIDNPETIEKYGLAGKQIVEQYYPEKVLAKLQMIYEELLMKD